MKRRTVSTRLALAGSLAGLVLGGTAVLAPTTAGSAPALTEDFAPQLITVHADSRAARDKVVALGLDVTEHAGHDYVEVVLHTAAERRVLEDAGFDYEVRIPDLGKRLAQIRAQDEAFAKANPRTALPSGRNSYRTLADYEADMAALAKRHPKLVRSFTLKRPSVEGRPVKAVEIGRGVKKATTSTPTFLLMGLHHAREWPSGEHAMEFALDIAKNYGKKRRVTRLLNRARVVVVPVVNPDGFDLSRTDGGLVDLNVLQPDEDPTGLVGTGVILGTPGQAYKRKNCRVVDGESLPEGGCRATLSSPGGYGAGVDLNRNYAGFWGGPGTAGSLGDSADPNDPLALIGQLSPVYRGAAPFSEPETLNIRDLVASRQTTMLISNHTFGDMILRPNGVNPTTHDHDGIPVGDSPDEAGLKRLGAKMSAATGYTNQHGWELYDTTGTTEDWSYNATGGYGYTFEIGPDEFHPPFEDVVGQYVGTEKYAGKGLRAAYLNALAHASDTRYHGVLEGRTRKGTVLRLSKSFKTPTWESTYADSVSSKIRVGRNGRFRWVVNPSTRPVVKPRTYTETVDEPFHSQRFEGTAMPTQSSDHEFVVPRTASVLKVGLTWPTPDDLDLEVYRKKADGSLEMVGSSGNLPGLKEEVSVFDAAAGTYVLRVVNYASVSPSYELTASLFDGRKVTVGGGRERYTLTCSRGGTVLAKGKVFIKRGQVKTLRLKGCRARR
ncbi:MAG: M14 family zinc carboxypeptidase [Nocardioides sp.]|nr:M14 family zinc carboxypeptidase [Nocardioides sp.]